MTAHLACKQRLLVILSIAVAACGGNGGSSQPPSPAPTPAPAAAVELASGVATSTVAAITTVLGQSLTSAGGGAGENRTQPSMRRAIMRAALAMDMVRGPDAVAFRPAAVVACPHGGTINASCSSGGGTTTTTGSLSNCGLAEPGTTNILTASGGLTVTIHAEGLCGVSTIPVGVAVTSQFSNFSGTATNSTGTVLERVMANFRETETITGQGCAGSNGTGSVDGTLTDAIDAGGINVILTARNLTFTESSGGTPCVQQATVNGGLAVDDHLEPRTFSATLTGLHVTLLVVGTQLTQATLDGSVNNDCLGDVQFQTLAPLQFSPGSECPSAGQLAVMRADGTNGRIQFTTTGIELDFNADGNPDKTVSSCQDAAQCSG